MQAALSPEDIHHVLNTAEISDYDGRFEAIGGGEVNDTYKIYFGDKPIVLRVARDQGQQTLKQEARALGLLDLPHVPKLIFFDDNQPVNDRLWILETYVPGVTAERLSPAQFFNLGGLLAKVHGVTSDESSLDLRAMFSDNCKAFGDEQVLLNHPNEALRQQVHKMYEEFDHWQPYFDNFTPRLIHQDATPSNVLVDGDEVGLIDWEFSVFSDPMLDFPTIYYEDMEYNQGKWRIKIKPEEKTALFNGYEQAGGKIDEPRLKFWTRFDKLGAAVFLYWRLHESTRKITEPEREQFKLDLHNLTSSLNS